MNLFSGTKLRRDSETNATPILTPKYQKTERNQEKTIILKSEYGVKKGKLDDNDDDDNDVCIYISFS